VAYEGVRRRLRRDHPPAARGQGLVAGGTGERSDLNRSYVGEIERGRVIPSIVTAQKLATALGINMVGLLMRCEQLEQSRLARRINLAAIAC